MKGIENIGMVSSKKCRNGFNFFFFLEIIELKLGKQSRKRA